MLVMLLEYCLEMKRITMTMLALCFRHIGTLKRDCQDLYRTLLTRVSGRLTNVLFTD